MAQRPHTARSTSRRSHHHDRPRPRPLLPPHPADTAHITDHPSLLATLSTRRELSTHPAAPWSCGGPESGLPTRSHLVVRSPHHRRLSQRVRQGGIRGIPPPKVPSNRTLSTTRPEPISGLGSIPRQPDLLRNAPHARGSGCLLASTGGAAADAAAGPPAGLSPLPHRLVVVNDEPSKGESSGVYPECAALGWQPGRELTPLATSEGELCHGRRHRTDQGRPRDHELVSHAAHFMSRSKKDVVDAAVREYIDAHPKRSTSTNSTNSTASAACRSSSARAGRPSDERPTMNHDSRPPRAA